MAQLCFLFQFWWPWPIFKVATFCYCEICFLSGLDPVSSNFEHLFYTVMRIFWFSMTFKLQQILACLWSWFPYWGRSYMKDLKPFLMRVTTEFWNVLSCLPHKLQLESTIFSLATSFSHFCVILHHHYLLLCSKWITSHALLSTLLLPLCYYGCTETK